MSKEQLVELKKKLLESKRYKLAHIGKNNQDELEIEPFDDKVFFEEELKRTRNKNIESRVIKYIEISCEKILKALTEKNVEYDEIRINILPLFYIEDKNLDSKIDDEGRISQENLDQTEKFRNLVTIIIDFNIRNNNDYTILPESIYRILDNLMLPNFTIDYEIFASLLDNEGYKLNKQSFDDIYQARLNEEEIGFRIEFKKQKKYRKQ